MGHKLRKTALTEGNKQCPKATNGSVVRINYTGKLTNGTVFDTSKVDGREPLSFRLGQNQVLPKLEAEIIGMSVGEENGCGRCK